MLSAAKTIIIFLAAGFILSGCASSRPGSIGDLGPLEARDWLKANPGAQLIDVRTREEYSQEHLAGAKLIPVQELGDRVAEIAQDKPVILYCHSGKRSQQAADLLKSRGFKDLRQIAGGITAWKEKNLPVESTAPSKP